jgi:DNA-directed RNA polymerase specialized sigma24 family protein
MITDHTSLHFASDAKGFVAIVNRGQSRVAYCPVSVLADVLIKRNPEDLYFSLNTFAKLCHSSDCVWQYTAAYVGLDVRQVGLEPEDVLADFKRYLLGSSTVPTPSYVLHSGNGLWLVWLIHPVTRRYRRRWEAVQACFRSIFSLWPTDPNDASKLIRVNGSHNTTARQDVRLEVLTGDRYLLDDLFEYVPEADQTRVQQHEQVAQRRQQRLLQRHAGGERPRNVGQILAARLRDLQQLVELRRGVRGGYRNHLLTIWTSTKYSLCRDSDETMAGALALNEEFTVPLRDSQVRAIVRTCTRHLYRWTTERIIDRLAMTPEECSQMETLRERSVTVTSPLRDKNSRQLRAEETIRRVLAAKDAGGASNRQIARELGISEGTVRRALRRAPEVRNETAHIEVPP